MSRTLPIMMIKIKLPARTIGIAFHHKKVQVPVEKNVLMARGRVLTRNIKGITRETMATFCGIYEIGLKEPDVLRISDGSAVVGIGDKFIKASGRRIALTRALDKLSSDGKISHYEREKVWEGYKNRGKSEDIREVVH